MQEGTVKFFNVTKGFGFIVPANGDSEIFVHSTGLIDEIRENDKVEYDVESNLDYYKQYSYKLPEILGKLFRFISFLIKQSECPNPLSIILPKTSAST
jgi:CspA family cold shock protein